MSFAFGFFLTWPKYVDLQNVETNIAEKNTEIKNRQDYYDNLVKISNQLENYQANVEKIRSAFPTSQDAPALMSFVQAAAMESGLILKGVDYVGSNETNSTAAEKISTGSGGEATSPQTLRQYTIAAELIGSYGGFKDFLSRIENSSRMIGLDQIAINSAKEEKNEGKPTAGLESQEKVLEYTVNLVANYYR
jgi:Tfp pilus assembly protein PilO